MKLKDLPSILPLYAGDGTILLPRAQLPLLLKKREEKDLIDYAFRQGHRLVGLVQINPDGGYFQTGCVGKIVGFQDGPYIFVTFRGICRFDLTEILVDSPIHKAKVSYEGYKIDLDEPQTTDPFVDRPRLLNLLKTYLDDQEIMANWEEIDHASDELIISSLSMACPFKPIEKQALLESSSLAERCDIMMALMEFASPYLKGELPILH